MTSEEMKATVRRYYDELWSKGNVALIDELFTEDYVNIDPVNPGGQLEGREALRGLVTTYRTAFPDLAMPIIEQYCDAETGTVTSVWLASGTQLGEMLGVPPTGIRGGNVMGVTITQFEDGKIAQDRAVWDALGLLRQLGVIPAPETVGA
jgi:steroid delta-isomerase-like uncharacterized protein